MLYILRALLSVGLIFLVLVMIHGGSKRQLKGK